MNIERLREIALALPHVEEDVKWEVDLCFCIGEKMFCVTGLEQPAFRASFKATPQEFEELTSRPGIIPAPYLARYKWVQVNEDVLTDKEWERCVKQSYELVRDKLPKKVLRVLEGQAGNQNLEAE